LFKENGDDGSTAIWDLEGLQDRAVLRYGRGLADVRHRGAGKKHRRALIDAEKADVRSTAYLLKQASEAVKEGR
jgi:transposase